MIDNLKDLLAHTHALGCLDLVKVEGTETTTVIKSIADDRSVILTANFKKPIDGFIGVFGMPNLGILKTIINTSEYDNDANITVISDAAKGPVSLNFSNSTGDFNNNYRFTVKQIIQERMKDIAFMGVNWNIELEPSLASIQRLQYQSAANKTENTFCTKLENGNLSFYFGNPSTHAGNFIFAEDISGNLNQSWHWPVSQVINILNLPGNKIMRLSNDGCMQIDVDSGMAIYEYILPAQS